MKLTISFGDDHVEIDVEGPYESEDGLLMVIATIPGDKAVSSRQMYRGDDLQIPMEIVKIAAGCLYPQYASPNCWDYGNMG